MPGDGDGRWRRAMATSMATPTATGDDDARWQRAMRDGEWATRDGSWSGALRASSSTGSKCCYSRCPVAREQSSYGNAARIRSWWLARHRRRVPLCEGDARLPGRKLTTPKIMLYSISEATELRIGTQAGRPRRLATRSGSAETQVDGLAPDTAGVRVALSAARHAAARRRHAADRE